MQFRFASDEFARLVCTVTDGQSHAVVTASDFARACDDLANAVQALELNGIGECYWGEGGGEYRWIFRCEGDRVRVAVLWMTGVVTGWEHVFWSEPPHAEFLAAVREGLATAAAPVA